MMSEIVYRQEYTLMGLPKWVFNNEGGAAWIDTQHGRYWLKPGDIILYDAEWNPIDVERGHPVTRLSDRRCPKCGSKLLTNGRALWCSFIGGGYERACDYGIKERVLVE